MAKDTKKHEDEPEDDKPAKAKAEKAKEPEPVQNTAQEPYPHGNPPDPEDEFERIHGFRRGPAKEEK